MVLAGQTAIMVEDHAEDLRLVGHDDDARDGAVDLAGQTKRLVARPSRKDRQSLADRDTCHGTVVGENHDLDPVSSGHPGQDRVHYDQMDSSLDSTLAIVDHMIETNIYKCCYEGKNLGSMKNRDITHGSPSHGDADDHSFPPMNRIHQWFANSLEV